MTVSIDQRELTDLLGNIKWEIASTFAKKGNHPVPGDQASLICRKQYYIPDTSKTERRSAEDEYYVGYLARVSQIREEEIAVRRGMPALNPTRNLRLVSRQIFKRTVSILAFVPTDKAEQLTQQPDLEPNLRQRLHEQQRERQ